MRDGSNHNVKVAITNQGRRNFIKKEGYSKF